MHLEKQKTTAKHQGVMINEILLAIKPVSDGRYLDATFGAGGHSQAILEKSSPQGKLVALDRDPNTYVWANELKSRFKDRFTFFNCSYDEFDQQLTDFDGIVADLGLSSDQLDDSERGFSFGQNSPLDLRFNPRSGRTAAQILNQDSLSDLTKMFRDYAQDRYAFYLAKKIVASRKVNPIKTTFDFNNLVKNTNPKVLAPLYQALRIETNNELACLKAGLPIFVKLLKQNGVLAVISFHSLEDAIVKSFFKNSAQIEIVTKKPITPSNEEIKNNPRCRSAKLRIARKIN